MTNSDRPLRIALVITELNAGGAERCLVNLATGLDPRLFATEVYSLQPKPEAARSLLVNRLTAAGIPVHFLGATSVWQLLRTLQALRLRLAAQRPDVVQTFLYHANVVGARAAPPQAAVVGGIRVADPRRGRSWLERQTLSRAARIVCVSESVAEFARQVARFPADRIVVIPNGVAESEIAGAPPADLSELGIRHDDSVILFAGRLDAQKGIDWLLKNINPVLESYPTAHLVLAGDGPDRAALESQSGDLPCAARLHFVGWRNDVPQLLSRARLLVLPSRWEGMPNVILEAMAAGTPIVSSRANGVEELLGAGSEQIVDFGADAELRTAIGSLLSDQSLCDRVRERNLSRVATHHSLVTMVARYAELYRTVLNPPSAS